MTEEFTKESRNRAVLVGLSVHSLPREDNASETSLEELAALVETAGGESVGMILQQRDAPEARSSTGPASFWIFSPSGPAPGRAASRWSWPSTNTCCPG